MKSYILIFICVPSLLILASCASTKNSFLFDYSFNGTVSPVDFSYIESPSRMFSVKLGFQEQDKADKIIVSVINGEGKEQDIGIAVRAIDVKWYQTQLGEILVISPLFDTHQNAVFVLFPQIDTNREITISCLYSTPSLRYTPSAVKYPLDHVYWKVKDVSPTGVLTIEGMWDFTFPGISAAREFHIPLFYGYLDDGGMNTDSAIK